MLIKKSGSAFTGLINAVILAVPMWAIIAVIVYALLARFEIIVK